MLNLKGNAAAAATEQIVVGLTYFVFYGVLIRTVGAEQVGAISLVLVLSSIVSLAGSGFASALSYFVPKLEAEGDPEAAACCIETALLCTALLFGLAVVIAYVPFTALIVRQAGPEYDTLVRDLMPAAAVQVVLLGLSTTTSLALTAVRRSDRRLWATLCGTAVALLTLALAVPSYGAVAGLWALAIQSATVTIVGWVQLARSVPVLSRMPWRLDWGMAARLLRLGLNMQTQSLLLAGAEPVTRLLLGHFGSLSSVAYFSLANRLVVQMRAPLYAAAQPLLPAFSRARGLPDQTAFSDLYHRAEALMRIGALVIFSAAIGAAPFIGEVWIGSRQPNFVFYSVVLALGWLCNTLTLAGYFSAYSLGRMNWSLFGYLVLFVLNAIGGLLFGWLFGTAGVVGAYALALVLSSLTLIFLNKEYAPISKPSYAKLPVFAASAAVAALASVFAYDWLRGSLSAVASGLACGFLWFIVMLPAILLNPVTAPMLLALRRRLLPGRTG